VSDPRLPRPGISVDSSLGTFEIENVLYGERMSETKKTDSGAGL